AGRPARAGRQLVRLPCRDPGRRHAVARGHAHARGPAVRHVAPARRPAWPAHVRAPRPGRPASPLRADVSAAMPRTIVAIVGATATGKTPLGEALAEKLGGEVVCADARQVFRELEIGSGKPTPAERAARPHHLFEWLTLESRPTAGAWARAAAAACESCFERGCTPVL